MLASGLLGAHSVAAADLDRDGRPDVIVGSRESGVVVWYRNLGNNQYATTNLAAAPGVYMVQPVDLNRDGRMDIAVVAVTQVDPALAADAAAVKAPAGAGVLFWLENKLPASPGFVRHDIAGGLNYPVAVRSADLDGNGAPDLVVATRDDNRVTWYQNNGAAQPGFTPYVVASDLNGAAAVHMGDIDGDGHIDIVTASENDNRIMWFRNNGGQPPVFTPNTIRNGPPPPPNLDFAKSVFVADVNGDGSRDVVYASEQENQIGWYENRGRGAQWVQHILVTDADHAKFVTAADVDRDGDLDILAASTYDYKVRLLENDGQRSPTFTVHVVASDAKGAHSVAAADMNGDGTVDLLSASRDDGRVVLYVNNTTHRTAILDNQEAILGVYKSARSVTAADLDMDGRLDVLSVADQEVDWHHNDGGSPPHFTSHLIADNLIGGRWISTADVDGDGDPDVLVADTEGTAVSLWWFENQLAQPGATPTFVPHAVSTQARYARDVHAADLDGDGDLDLYAASDRDNTVAWYENVRSGQSVTFVRHVVANDAAYARSSFAADVDGDGDLDLMSASASDHKVAWYENTGGHPLNWVPHVLTTTAHGARHIFADDLDRDGRMDILAAAEYDNAVYWFRNKGGSPPSFEQRTVSRSATGAHAIVTADMDMDGDPDIVAANEAAGALVWYENDGASPPNFTEHNITRQAPNAHGVWTADLDGDGDLDVLSASRLNGYVRWHENLGGQYALSESRPGVTSADGAAVLLALQVAHRGRAGDALAELNALTLEFLGGSGQPLTIDQVKALYTQISLYRDGNGNGVFEPGADLRVAHVTDFLGDAAGRLILPLNDGDPNGRLAPGSAATFFVVANRTAVGCSALGSVQVRNIPTASTMQNLVTQIPLQAELVRGIAGSNSLTAPVVLINELMADNTHTLEDPDEPGEFPDWIELFNPTSLPISLGGMYLTDDPSAPRKYQIPTGVVLPANGYLVFYADGDPDQGPLHTNFKLSSTGETVGLFDTDAGGNRPLDSADFGALGPDVSFGRLPNGSSTWSTLPLATPRYYNLPEALSRQFFVPVVLKSPDC